MNSAKKYTQHFLSHVAVHCSKKRKQLAKRKAIRDSVSTGFLNNRGAKTNFNHIDLQLRGFR